MKANTFYLFDNGKKIAFSGSFEKLLYKTTETKNAEIYYNNVLVWKQKPIKETTPNSNMESEDK